MKTAPSLPLAWALIALFSALAPLTATAQWSNGRKANAVIGQPNFTSSAFSTAANRLNTPLNVAVDPTTGKIFVADRINNRVLRFPSAAAMAKGASAEAVFGQPDFTSNAGSAMRNRLLLPLSVFVDSSGRLWVADSGNNRVLHFDNASSLGNEPDADTVLGQTNFINDASATTATGMDFPTDATVDVQGTLWVADANNNRVLKFANAAGKGNGAAADAVLGQPGFLSNSPGTTATSMNSPRGVATRLYFFFNGTAFLPRIELWVSDTDNNRVLRFDNAANKSNGAAADGVLGQTLFTANGQATSQNRLRNPIGLAIDGSDLWVADGNNERVLRFADAGAKSNGGQADNVIGKSDFTTSGEIYSQSSLGSPSGVAIDAGGHLLVADAGGSRVLRFSPGHYRVDSLVGRKANPNTQKGDGIYNTSAAGQKIRIRRKRKAAKVRFTCQNEGPSDDRFRFRSKRGNRKVKVKYFQLDGGRTNITGQITTGRYDADIGYRSSARFVVRARVTKKGLKAGKRRTKRRLFLQVTSHSNGAADRVLARVVLIRKKNR